MNYLYCVNFVADSTRSGIGGNLIILISTAIISFEVLLVWELLTIHFFVSGILKKLLCPASKLHPGKPQQDKPQQFQDLRVVI